MFEYSHREKRWRARVRNNQNERLPAHYKNGMGGGPRKTINFKRRFNQRSIARDPPLLFDWENIDEKTVEKIQERMESGQLNPEKDMRKNSKVVPPLKLKRIRKKNAFRPDIKNYSKENPNYPIMKGVLSWNLEGKCSPEEIDKVLIEKAKMPDIVCLQEINIPESLDSTENFKWFHSGTCGSAILLNKSLKGTEVTLVSSICEQIFVADFDVEGFGKTRVISCLVPPPTNYLCEELWIKLEKTLREIPSDYGFIVAGDFNAQIGKVDASKFVLKKSMGLTLNHETSNENGLKLISLIRKASMGIVNAKANTMTGSKTTIGTHTFKDGETKIQQDFILVQRFGCIQPNYSFLTGFNYHWLPDHRHAILESCVKIYKNKATFYHYGSGKEELLKPILSTWNIQGSSPSKVDAILNEQDLLVVGIQELFVTSDSDLDTEHFTWYFSGKHWSKGVAFAVKKSPDIQLTKFEPISDCLCTADLQCYGTSVKVISCFVPPEEDSRNESVKSELTKLVLSIPVDTMFFVAGDFNGRFVDGKLPENEHSNEVFLKKFAEETALALYQNLWDQGVPLNQHMVTRVTDTDYGRPHQILMPVTVKLNHLMKMHTRLIPFFENAIVSLIMVEGNSKEKDDTKTSIKYEHKDGLVYKIKLHEVMEPIECDENCRPSPEDQEKFRDCLPSVEDLARLLKDFVLLNAVSDKGQIKGPFSFYAQKILIASFREARCFGSFVVEEVEGVGTIKYISPIVRIRWQGILLSENKTNKKTSLSPEEFKYKLRLAAVSLLEKLASFCYMIKEKTSYINKGHEPIWMNDPEFKDAMKVYKKTDCPTMPEVLKFIENFCAEDTDCELAFGPDFSKEELENIKRFAEEKSLNYRYFTLAENPKESNLISVFKKRTPQYIRDKILKNEDDIKYFFIPPYKTGVPDLKKYSSYISSYQDENSICVEDKKNFSKYWSFINMNKDEKQSANSKTGTPKIFTMAAKKPAANSVSVKTTQKQPQELLAKKTAASRASVKPRQRQRQEFWQRSAQVHQTPTRKRGVDYDQLNDELQIWKSPPSYGSNPNLTDQRFVQGNRFETDYPQPKRQMLSNQVRAYNPVNLNEGLPKRKVPLWTQLEPLILVWPITTRSQVEERPWIVLSENFPIEYPVNRHNQTAAVVTLPMRNGSQQQYCLSVGSNQKRVAREALDLIVKHSTVIKPSPSYLCDGQAPNFIRYNVPCQTNPRTYIILSRRETGALTQDNLCEMLEAFISSHNEDVFFDRFSYSISEKNLVISMAQKYRLKFRHFGEGGGIVDRWVCVYKLKPKEQLVEEVLKMRGYHPKYTITANRLPPRVRLNIF